MWELGANQRRLKPRIGTGDTSWAWTLSQVLKKRKVGRDLGSILGDYQYVEVPGLTRVWEK